MEHLIPFMLFLVQADKDGETELVRHPHVFADEELCRTAAQQLASDAVSEGREALRTFYIAVPDRDEYEEMFRRIEERTAEKRDQRLDSLRTGPDQP